MLCNRTLDTRLQSATLCTVVKQTFSECSSTYMCHGPSKNGNTKGDLRTLVFLFFSFFELNLYEVITKESLWTDTSLYVHIVRTFHAFFFNPVTLQTHPSIPCD